MKVDFEAELPICVFHLRTVFEGVLFDLMCISQTQTRGNSELEEHLISLGKKVNLFVPSGKPPPRQELPCLFLSTINTFVHRFSSSIQAVCINARGDLPPTAPLRRSSWSGIMVHGVAGHPK